MSQNFFDFINTTASATPTTKATVSNVGLYPTDTKNAWKWDRCGCQVNQQAASLNVGQVRASRYQVRAARCFF